MGANTAQLVSPRLGTVEAVSSNYGEGGANDGRNYPRYSEGGSSGSGTNDQPDGGQVQRQGPLDMEDQNSLSQREAAEGEEGRGAKGLPAPQRVSAKEREEHNLTHTPYRAWCKYCVQGRGKKAAHRRKGCDDDDEEIREPRVSMDYFFMHEEDKGEEDSPLIVMVDDLGEKYARVVERKGVEDMDWLIKDMSAELMSWGYPGGENNKLILKADGEPSITAVRNALGRLHGGTIIPEAPARGESQSNGLVEEAGKTVREFTRVLKEQVEGEANIKLGPADTIVAWMVRWAAMVCSRFLAGKDGRTACERKRDKKCSGPVVPFGEKGVAQAGPRE